MTTRFCPGCRTEVQDAGGFCLLGHRLALEPPTASLQELRAEVDGSFEEADLGDIDFGDAGDEAWERLVEPALAGAVASPVAPARPAPSAPARRVPPPPPPASAPKTAPTRRTPPPPPPPALGAPEAPAPAPVRPIPQPSREHPEPLTPAAPVERPFVPPAPATLPPNPASPALVEDVAPGDPINDFAPAPRMDWGPEKGRMRISRRKGRTEESA